MMLIGLTGSHRTGKTTLCEDYAAECGAVFARSDVSGSIKKWGGDAKGAMTISDRLAMQKVILSDLVALLEKAVADNPGAQIVTDRTPLDVYMYMLTEVCRNSMPTDEEDIQIMIFLEECIEQARRLFTMLLLVQPGILVQEDSKSAQGNIGSYLLHANVTLRGLISMTHWGFAEAMIIPASVTDRCQRVRVLKSTVAASLGRHASQRDCSVVH